MKNLIVFVVATVFGLATVSAQDIKPSFGFKAGAEFTQFDTDADIDDATGFHVGAVLHVPLVKKFGIQPELIYSFSDVEDAFKISTIDVPVLATYKLAPGLRVNLGPQIKIDAGSSFDNEEFAKAAGAEFNSLNFDLLAGLEYKFPVVGVFVQARYQLGITNTVDSSRGEFVSVDEVKENGFLVSVGYRF